MMAYIEDDLVRALYALKEIEGYLNEKEPRAGDASYACMAVLSSFEGSPALAEATKRIQNR
jgi:hypothetical protein